MNAFILQYTISKMFCLGWSFQHAEKLQANIINGIYTLESDNHASVYKKCSGIEPSVFSALISVYI